MADCNEPTYPYGRTLGELATSKKLWSQFPTAPNWITAARALVGTMLQLILMVFLPLTWWPFLNFVFWGATDWVDGRLAKKHGMGSVLGKILDPFSDKIYVIFVLIGLIIQYALRVDQAFVTGVRTSLDLMYLIVFVTLLGVTVFTVVRDAKVTKMRFEEALPYGNFESARQTGRVKMVVQIIALSIFMVPFAIFIHDEAWLVAVELFKLLLLSGMLVLTVASWRDYKRHHAER